MSQRLEAATYYGGAGLVSVVVVIGTIMGRYGLGCAVRHRIVAGRSAPLDLGDPVQLEVFD